MPKVTIDGKVVTVAKNSVILDAAKKAGIWIPTLCYHPAVSSTASCRICMVEVDRGGWYKLVTACNYPIRRDTMVRVNSEKAIKARRGVMQLLLARSPDCQELKALAAKMGVKSTPYPKVTESQRNCILCGLCVSVCEEVIGCAAISFAGRGAERTVTPPFRLASENCIACGACAVICPVGTIQVRIHLDAGEAEISPFKSRVKLLKCKACGAQLVTTAVNKKMLEQIKIDKQEFRKKIQLCAKCKRKNTAKALSLAVNNTSR